MQMYVYLVVFITTAFVPAVLSYVMWKNGTIESLHMEKRSERMYPFIMTLICYGTAVYVLIRLPVPRLFPFMIAGATLAVLLGFIINFRWKISIHMIGIGGLVGLMYSFAYFFHAEVLNVLVVLALLAGILGTARLISKSHVPSQIYVGFIGGFLTEFFFIRALFALANA